MKSGLLIFNVVLLLLVGVLFYLHFSSRTKSAPVTGQKEAAISPNAPEFRIAYFEMDSIESSYAMVNDVKNELTREEKKIESEKERLAKMFRDKYAQYQNQSQSQQMTQVQSEMATRDLQQTQKQIDDQVMSMEQRYQDMRGQRMTEIKNRIEQFLKDYNKDKGYSYIFANEPGLIYYRDTAYNITGDVVKGLNALYKKK